MANDYIQHERIDEYMKYAKTALHTVNGLAIKASASADAKTTAASVCSFDTIFKSLATQATLDLSGAEGTLTIADDEYAVVYLFLNKNGSTTVFTPVHNSMVVPYTIGWDADGDADTYFDAGEYCCFGAIKILNESGSTFTIGTTALDTSDVTVTYYTPQFLVPGDTLAA